jgi:hypothetical protein
MSRTLPNGLVAHKATVRERLFAAGDRRMLPADRIEFRESDVFSAVSGNSISVPHAAVEKISLTFFAGSRR